jgi:hypothetical protein
MNRVRTMDFCLRFLGFEGIGYAVESAPTNIHDSPRVGLVFARSAAHRFRVFSSEVCLRASCTCEAVPNLRLPLPTVKCCEYSCEMETAVSVA